MHIAIAGNIGAGKTTLAKLLGESFKCEVLFEAVEGNPYLADFYGDMKRWAFHLQMFFLKSRFEQVAENKGQGRHFIQDRTIYEDAHIFAKNLTETGLMTETDSKTYQDFFKLMVGLISPPDLMIYLKADLPKLKKQIALRGRNFENNIADQYLMDLNRLYEAFIKQFNQCKVLTINVNDMDFVQNKQDYSKIRESIELVLKTGKSMEI